MQWKERCVPVAAKSNQEIWHWKYGWKRAFAFLVFVFVLLCSLCCGCKTAFANKPLCNVPKRIMKTEKSKKKATTIVAVAAATVTVA